MIRLKIILSLLSIKCLTKKNPRMSLKISNSENFNNIFCLSHNQYNKILSILILCFTFSFSIFGCVGVKTKATVGKNTFYSAYPALRIQLAEDYLYLGPNDKYLYPHHHNSQAVDG